MTAILQFVFIFMLLCNVDCQFFGGSLSWKFKDNDSSKIQLTYRQIENSSLLDCNSTTRSTKISSQNVTFETYTANNPSTKTTHVLVGDRYDCVDVSRTDTWFSRIYKNLDFTYGDMKEFYIGPQSQDLYTKVNVNTRPITYTINNSPVASTIPLIAVALGATYTAKIAVVDDDHDHIKCGFANNSFNTFPIASQTIDQGNCTVSVTTSGVSPGTYGIAVLVEDYESVHSNTPLSSVPVQFKIAVIGTAAADICLNITYPSELQSHGTCISMATETMNLDLIAAAGCSSGKNLQFVTNSPIGTTMSDVIETNTSYTPSLPSGIVYEKTTVTFNKSEWNDAENSFCFSAMSSDNSQAESICWTLLDINKTTPMRIEPLYPGPSTLHPLSLDTITLLFHGIFTSLPTLTKTLRIYDSADNSLVKSINISTECSECTVLSANQLQIRLTGSLPWQRGKKYYIQVDNGIATSPSGCVESAGISDATSWTFVTDQFVTNSNVRIDMTLYSGSDYTSQLSTPYKFTLGDILYVDMRINGEVDSLSVIPQNCYVTRIPNPDAADKYYLLKDRCPSDNTYRTYNAPGKAYRFGFETLRFVGDSDLTYLHCGVYICIAESSEPACSKSCNGGQKRKRRSIDSSYGFEYRLQTGPIFLERKKDMQHFTLIQVAPFRDKAMHNLSPGQNQQQNFIVYNNSQSSLQTFLIVFVASICAIMTCYVLKLFFSNIIVIETTTLVRRQTPNTTTFNHHHISKEKYKNLPSEILIS